MRYSIAVMLCVLPSFIHGEEPYRFNETLPIMVSRGKTTIELPFRNNSLNRVVFQAHSVSCGCIKVKFSKLDVPAGESITIPIEVDTSARTQDALDVKLLIDGIRLEKDANSERPRVRLAEYQVTIPLSTGPVRLLNSHDALIVSNGKCNPIEIVNASTFSWDEVRVETSVDGVVAESQVAEAKMAESLVQVAKVSLAGLERLTGEEKFSSGSRIELNVHARPKGKRVFVGLGSVSVNLQVYASIEMFPQRIVMDPGADKVKINVVGRAQSLEGLIDGFRVDVDGRELRASDYHASALSERWLRFEIHRRFLTPNKGNTIQILLRCEKLGWKGRVEVSELKADEK